MTALSDLLAEHRPWSSHRCRCGWEGDRFDVHLHDMLIIPANRDALVAGLIEAGVLEKAHKLGSGYDNSGRIPEHYTKVRGNRGDLYRLATG